jgi:hypothetical protein
VSHDDFAVEPVRGLPEAPPAGEFILWQGSPLVRIVACEIFHMRAVGAYFAALMVWRGVDVASYGMLTAVGAALSLLPVALVGLALLWLLAWGTARTTVYTLTNRRLVLRFGLALPLSLNLPLTKIASAGFAAHARGAGDIVITTAEPLPLNYFHLWPHVRPFAGRFPQPMLRGIPDAVSVAENLRKALQQTAAPRLRVVSPEPANDGLALAM